MLPERTSCNFEEHPSFHIIIIIKTNKIGRAISYPAYLQIICLCVLLILELSPQSDNSRQAKSEKQYGGGFGNAMEARNFNRINSYEHTVIFNGNSFLLFCGAVSRRSRFLLSLVYFRIFFF